MTGLKAVVRRGFAGGGAATLLLAGLFAVGGGTEPMTLLLAGWLAVVGLSLLLAGRRERLTVGGRTVGWPRVAAVGICVLAVGSGVFGLSRLRQFAVGSTTWLLTGLVTLFVLGYLAWFALECWRGGWQLDDAMFAVE
ncbi:hypothetical protein ACFR99_07590 [Haloarchaeobius amylolyticus]|uniref:Uncharacterized protein n=1 Tax=Haloarchaeobius amylolyticus TaxID=1198296 RepID=A0ABD6BE85_9EURY